MKRISSYIFCVLLCLSFTSCNQKKSDTTVTERIQYDVTINNNDEDVSWWVNNMEGPRREFFVKTIMDAAYDGKVRTFDYFNNPLSPEQVRMIGFRTDTLSFQRTTPPYMYYDTVVHSRLDFHDIVKVRFLEEWTIDETSMIVTKACSSLWCYNRSRKQG